MADINASRFGGSETIASNRSDVVGYSYYSTMYKLHYVIWYVVLALGVPGNGRLSP